MKRDKTERNDFRLISIKAIKALLSGGRWREIVMGV